MTTTLTLASAPDPAWWRSRVVRRFLSHRLAVLGLVMITLLSLACAFGPHLLPYDSLQIDLRGRFAPPLTGDHYLGADPLGRDLAARLLMAGRISLLVGFFSMLLATFVGTLVGVIAGYMGGWVNTVLMRTVDGFLSFPTLFLLLALAVALKPSPVMITIIISLTSWMTVARIVATEVATLKEREFVLAGRMLGLSRAHIMFREILPNAMGPIIVAATLTVARAILLEAYISYLGFGIQPPLPSWGNMLDGAQQYLDRAPWLAIIPGLAITMAVTSFNLIGDGLRDALDIRGEHK